MPRPYISAVITCLNEEKTIGTFVEQLVEALDGTGVSYEVVLVDDGSKDQTFATISKLMIRYRNLAIGLELMKNAGQVAAITAGMAETTGEYVLMMDSDLQLDPHDIGLLIAEAKRGADIVNAYRQHRKDPWSRKVPSLLANWVMRKISETNVRDFGCTFRLVDAKLVSAFKLGPERLLSIPLLISRAGRIREVAVSHRPRPHGKSGWTFRKLWRYNADNVVILCEPLFQGVGFTSLAVAFLLVLRVVLDPVLHWAILPAVSPGLILNAVAATGLVLAGLLCVVGEFVVRCHRSVLARPGYVVRQRVTRATIEEMTPLKL